MTTNTGKNPFDLILLPYQRRIFTDTSRFIAVLASRQCGKSLTLAAKAVYEAISAPNSLTCIVSVNERSAQEFLRKILQWSQACRLYRPDLVEYSNNASQIQFSNGSRIITLPSSPSALRGFSGNIIWDEAAICDNDLEMWQALLPIITSQMNGTKRIVVSSTPTSLDTVFSQIWHDQSGQWSRHRITIEDAVVDGLKADIGQLRKVVSDDLIWNTEYMCQFCSGAGTAFPPEWMQDMTDVSTWKHDDPLYLGYDVARTGDFSAFVIASMDKSGIFTVREIHQMRDVPFNTQLEFARSLEREHHFTGGFVDATGIGSMMAEEIQRTVNGRIRPFTFNQTNKTEAFDNLRTSMQDGKFRCLKEVESCIRSDFSKVRRYISSTGRISFSAPHSKDGHADIASGIVLAHEAAHQFPANMAVPQTP